MLLIASRPGPRRDDTLRADRGPVQAAAIVGVVAPAESYFNPSTFSAASMTGVLKFCWQ
jgi:hypothetical protein